MTGQGLSAAERIRRRSEFEHLYREGVRIHGRLMTVFVLATSRAVARLGVAATQKLGSAVKRSRAKRLAREIFRRHKVTTGLDIVIVPRPGMLDASFASLEADYRAAFERRHSARPKRSVAGSGNRRRSGATSSV